MSNIKTADAIQIQHQIQIPNSFGVEAIADQCVSFSKENQLKNLVSLINNRAAHDFMILGAGSNVLFAKESVQRLIVLNQLKGISIVCEDENDAKVAVNAGENWHQFVHFCVQHGLYGLENLALIPGNVGSAPVQNIGAYGIEVSDFIDKVRCFDFHTQKIVELSSAQCIFRYRHSIFKEQPNRYFILQVFFRLKKKFIANLSYKVLADHFKSTASNIGAKELFEAVIEIRQSKLPDPNRLGNAGSFFQNPVIDRALYQELQLRFSNLFHFPDSLDQEKVKLSAGQLIELCGLKGHREGQVGMYEKQALILVNYGGAKGSELIQYAKHVQSVVMEKFGIFLQIEPCIID